ncbi:MAG: hypothetical protein KBD01_02985 [Acidobacteria bacterium]|nr:hypothetical protein [Acidobacteriota bacterium]
MLVKTYQGRTGAEALARVRGELGPDACILETRRGPAGVEVLAAAERPGPRRALPGAAPCLPDSPAAERLRDDLVACGFSVPLAEQITAAALSNLDSDRLEDRQACVSYARDLIALWLPAGAPPRVTGSSLLVLVGAPGVGKTTTAAKLAARELCHDGRTVVLASCDTRRLGGAEQLEAYARVLGIPFHAVRNRRELYAAREAAGRRGTLLLDTPGISRHDGEALDWLAQLLAGTRPEEIELLLAADGEPEALAETVRRFARLHPGALGATRVDEAVRPGTLISALARTRLPLHHLGCGPDVPDDLLPADARRLAAWALPLPGQPPVALRREAR